MRISLIECDLCHTNEDKPKGMVPTDWFSYQVTDRPLDLCPKCREIIKKALSNGK